MKFALVMGSALVLLPVAPSFAGSVSERTTYFMVRGETIDEIRRSFGRGGPILSDGQRHGGRTMVDFAMPDVAYSETAGTCAVKSASIRLTVETTLPKWAPPAAATQDMMIQWRAMRDEVATHESRHAAIARTWQARVESQIRALRPARDCDRMKREVDATYRAAMARHRSEQMSFDVSEGRKADSRLQRRIDKNRGQFLLR